MNKKLFPGILEKAMKYNGLNQTQLSKISNVSQRSISRYLTGQSLPNYAEMVCLCKALHCSSDYLLGLDTETYCNLLPLHKQLIQNCLKGLSILKSGQMIDRSETWARKEMAGIRDAFNCQNNYQLFYKLGSLEILKDEHKATIDIAQ